MVGLAVDLHPNDLPGTALSGENRVQGYAEGFTILQEFVRPPRETLDRSVAEPPEALLRRQTQRDWGERPHTHVMCDFYQDARPQQVAINDSLRPETAAIENRRDTKRSHASRPIQVSSRWKKLYVTALPSGHPQTNHVHSTASYRFNGVRHRADPATADKTVCVSPEGCFYPRSRKCPIPNRGECQENQTAPETAKRLNFM